MEVYDMNWEILPKTIDWRDFGTIWFGKKNSKLQRMVLSVDNYRVYYMYANEVHYDDFQNFKNIRRLSIQRFLKRCYKSDPNEIQNPSKHRYSNEYKMPLLHYNQWVLNKWFTDMMKYSQFYDKLRNHNTEEI